MTMNLSFNHLSRVSCLTSSPRTISMAAKDSIGDRLEKLNSNSNYDRDTKLFITADRLRQMIHRFARSQSRHHVQQAEHILKRVPQAGRGDQKVSVHQTFLIFPV